jgi:hypothetical protein
MARNLATSTSDFNSPRGRGEDVVAERGQPHQTPAGDPVSAIRL